MHELKVQSLDRCAGCNNEKMPTASASNATRRHPLAAVPIPNRRLTAALKCYELDDSDRRRRRLHRRSAAAWK